MCTINFKMILAAIKSHNSVPNLEYIHVSFSSLIRGSSPLLDKKPTCFIMNKFLDQYYIILFSIFKINLNVSIMVLTPRVNIARWSWNLSQIRSKGSINLKNSRPGPSVTTREAGSKYHKTRALHFSVKQ